MNKLRKTLLILFAVLAFGQRAWAQTQYINQLMLIGDYEGVLIESNVQVYQEDGWTLVDYNLNSGTNSDQIIYLLYKTGLADDPDHAPITDFYFKSTSDKNDHPDMITYNNRDYYRITSIVGSDSFMDSYGDLNDGAGGKYIYLYYTTDAWDYPRGISEISYNSTSDGAICGNGGTEPQDLNEGAHGDYIYMHYKYAMTIDVIDVDDQWDFNPLNATCSDTLHFRLADVVANNEVITSSNIIVGNNNIAVIDLNGKYFGRLIQSGGGTDTGHVFKVIGNSTLIIIDSSTEGTGYIATGDADKGGAFYIDASSKLIINGGIIESCHADYGGAIYNLGTLIINGGTIQNCFATRGWGQGIIYNNGTLTINGGTIQNNTAYYGGAIYNVYGWTTTINGGVIQNNNAMENNGYYTDDGVGGGILNYGILYINGGTIQGNFCDREGGGIWMTDEGGLFMKGNPIIRDNKKGSDANNVYVPNEHKIINVVGDFTEGACIGVTPQTYDNRITNNYCDGHNIGVDPAGIFFSDNGYFIKLNDDNEVVLDQSISALMVNYIDAEGNEAFYSSCLPFSTITSKSDVTLNSGWYVLDVTIHYNIPINVDGNVNLILADGYTLTANAGIGMASSTNSLTIYGQNRQTGCINATGSTDHAGIGTSAGTISINGGIINATGGSSGGFGIGGGTTAINLNWTDASIVGESITASSYVGTVTLLKDFTDGTNVYSAGVVDDNSVLAGKILVPKIVFNSDGDWNDATKWNIKKEPRSTDSVFVFAAATIPDAYVAQVQNITIGTGGSITIEDGGQLISNSTQNVKVKKHIHKATNWGSGDYTPDYWYFISSPVIVANPDFNVSGLYTDGSGEDFDLYRLNNTIWENYEDWGHNHHHFDLEDNRGYLYASKNGTTIEFNGQTHSNTDTPVKLSEGFNLIGNPYTCNAYVDKPYYAMNGDGTAILTTMSTAAIPPCTGVIVEAALGDTVTFSTTQQNAHNGGLQIVLSQVADPTVLLDNAIVSFDEGTVLSKFYFTEQKGNIYIPQDGKDYAVAYAKGQGEIPLDFKAQEDGEYALAVQPEGVEMSYLHLIDYLTGMDVDLLDSSKVAYTFMAKATDDASRFHLVFSDQAPEPTVGSSRPFAHVSNGVIVVNAKGTLQVFDVLGRVIRSTDVVRNVSISGIVPGVYVLRLINGNDVKTQKMVIE